LEEKLEGGSSGGANEKTRGWVSKNDIIFALALIIATGFGHSLASRPVLAIKRT
jgi:hypothetical protein